MNKEISIQCEKLGKCFRVYENPKARLKQAIWRNKKRYYKEFWANRNITLEVNRGETVGIVGSNGSGKSTLLQMICGTLTPTTGTVLTHGRTSALLELGSGFNPEFSGLENIFLNGTILGVTTEEIKESLDDILSFAEIGNYINQPVKSYSSGMQVRLAFAVAINIRPEILIVDEALAVGDERFQRKCFSKIESLRKSGTTILFVSHSCGAIVDLCDRAILMDSGEIIADGTPKKIISFYQKLLYAPEGKKDYVKKELADEHSRNQKLEATKSKKSTQIHIDDSFDPNLTSTSIISYEEIGARIYNASIKTMSGKQVNKITRGQRYVYEYEVKFTQYNKDIIFGMLIKTISGVELGGATSCHQLIASNLNAGQGEIYLIKFEFQCSLNPGTYFMNAGVTGTVANERIYLHRIIDSVLFQVLPINANKSTAIVDFDITTEFKQQTCTKRKE